jgi:MoCo/4Fe-4S cofactor protein with predicted Tat translocation signal
MQETIKYWKGYEELEQRPEFVQHAHNEFPEFLPIAEKNSEGETSRRDFLKLMGFGLTAATLASCEAPVRKAIPWLNKPETVDPTISNFYASTYFTGNEYVSVLVKCRDGRPIKIEGNPMSTITRGGTSARAQASVLSLYDEARAKGPMMAGKAARWSEVDAEIGRQLAAAVGKTVALVTGTILSPSTKKAIGEFAARYPNFRHVQYDANSASALVKANGGVVPGYNFANADVVVSIGADFLGSWISPVEYAWHWAQKRKLKRENPSMSRLFQFEPMLSLTGANADIRAAVKPSQLPQVAAALYGAVVGGGNASVNPAADKAIAQAAEELKGARGRALVVCGTNDPASQTLVAEINRALGAEGTTIGAPSFVRQGDDAAMLNLIQEMGSGRVGAVLIAGCNPAYDHPKAADFKAGLSQVGLKVSFADRLDETAKLCDFLTPDSHYLESWNDYEPKRGSFSLQQPAITPLFDTRQMPETLLRWAGNRTSYYDYIRANWAGINWDQAVHDGVLEGGESRLMPAAMAAPMAASAALAAASQGGGQGPELVIYESVMMGFGGAEANNPWLQEQPDPISKNTWENYLAVSRPMAKKLAVEQGDSVKVTANGNSVTLPVLVQPGMETDTVAIAIGYGRTDTGKVGNAAGVNAYPLVGSADGTLMFAATGVQVVKAAEKARVVLAQTQTHHTIMDRLVVQESTLSKYRENREEVTEYEKLATAEGPQPPSKVSLWQDYAYQNHHWGMVIDLNSCIGCSACSVACYAENNVAVVGKQEVINRREMSWLRIDRYYTAVDHVAKDYETMEDAADQPQVVFQPMMCQHCNHAPCETVCPVLATTHSTEGLNQMTYNRCVGTKYCANNCPYKVRRFNWFSYTDDERFEVSNQHMRNDLGRMVLNPDVTVRARGVMEKCSMCVQRIQLGKLDAKKEKRRPKDGEIVTACAQACPTEAIVFGDMADPESRITKILQEQHRERAFHVLEEINVQPNITYLTKIRNGEVANPIIKKGEAAAAKQPA